MISRLGYELHSEACRLNSERALGASSEQCAKHRKGWRPGHDHMALVLSLWASVHGWAMLLIRRLLPPAPAAGDGLADGAPVIVHFVDGTYELSRCYYGNKHSNRPDDTRGAVRLVLHTLIGMVDEGATHLGVATDHVVESFETHCGRDTAAEGQSPPFLHSSTLSKRRSPHSDSPCGRWSSWRQTMRLRPRLLLPSLSRKWRKCIWTRTRTLPNVVVGERVVQVDRRGGISGTRRGPGKVRRAAGPFQTTWHGWETVLTAIPGSRMGSEIEPRLRSRGTATSRTSPWDEIPERLARSLQADWEQRFLFLKLATLRTDPGPF